MTNNGSCSFKRTIILAIAMTYAVLPALAEDRLSSGPLLFVNSARPAQLSVDGAIAGEAPFLLDSLKPGTHELVLRAADGIARVNITVDPAAKGVAVWTPAFGPYTGSLAVTSAEPGLAVNVDGKEAGATPLSLASIAEGRHIVSVAGAGYIPFVQEVVVPREGAAKLEAPSVRGYALRFDPALPAGSIVSLLDPAGGTVASWPCAEGRLLPAGKASFKVTGPGLPETAFEADPAESAPVALAPLASPSYIAVDGLSPGFVLTLDGREASAEGGKVAVSPGAHRVGVTADGRLPFYGFVMVGAGSTGTVIASLPVYDFVMVGAGSTGTVTAGLPDPEVPDAPKFDGTKLIVMGLGAIISGTGYVFNLNSVATSITSNYQDYLTVKNYSSYAMYGGLAIALAGYFFLK